MTQQLRASSPDRRDFIRTAVTLSIATLWQPGTTLAEEKKMKDTKNSKPGMLTYDDVRSVSPALE